MTADDSRFPSRPRERTASVLVVDDSEIMCELAARMLRGFGFRVELAHGGEQALDLLRSRTFDLVLMDCQMPGLDGFAVVRTYREIETQHRDGTRLPIIALTGETGADSQAACLESGMDDYLGKPYTAADLRRVVERWVRIPGR